MITKKIAFLDRDGTLIYEPQDTYQIDNLNKLSLLPGVIKNLKALQELGYELVMVTNQDGLGSKSFLQSDFNLVQERLLQILEAEGIKFSQVYICPHLPEENCECRKPKVGLITDYLASNEIDQNCSFVCGDRDSDRQFAANLNLRFIPTKTNSQFNPLPYLPRQANVVRQTNETNITVALNLDGSGQADINTGIGFFNHMLELFAKHALIDLKLNCQGDLWVDEHHTVEDVGIALGQATNKALGEKRGIKRYGFLLPMDETLAEVAIDLSGRSYLVWNAEFKREKIGDLPTELFPEFFRALADNLRATIHINLRYGQNEHHKIEAIFKAFARSLQQACRINPRAENILPSTKGLL